MNPDRRVIGIDVSKDKCDYYSTTDNSRGTVAVENYDEFVSHLAKMKPDLVVLEATGGYELPLTSRLFAANLPVSVMNPRQIRDYAKGIGVLAKTDTVDAKVIALFGKGGNAKPCRIPDAELAALKALVNRRNQLVTMQTMDKNRLQQAVLPRVRKSLEKHLKTLNKEISVLDAEIIDLIKSSPILHEKEELLTSIPGIGETTACKLLADAPELGTMSGRQISALAGLAPFAQESGKWKGLRSIRGGRAGIRTTLFMSVITSIRGENVIADYYRRLKEKGKASKVAITACMRKLLTIANSIIKNKTPFHPISP
jgi:transposase